MKCERCAQYEADGDATGLAREALRHARIARSWLMLSFVCAVLALLVLAACTEVAPTIHHGMITGKEFSPPYDTTSSMCISYGKYGLCQLSMPVTDHHPARYYIDVTDCLHDTHNSQCRHESREVSAGSYNAATVGAVFDDGTGKPNGQ